MRELGQHFLIDAAVADAIIAAAAPKPTETVIEIGPGKGALTKPLASRCKKLIAIEIDPALARQLKKEFAKQNNVGILTGNALQLLPQLSCDLLISNTPYPIAEALIRLLPRLRFKRCVLALPEPLARTLQSESSTTLALFFQLFFSATAVARLPAAATEPPAPHDGNVLRIVPRPPADAGEAFLRELLRVPSRQLRNGVRESLMAAGFCATKREGRALATELLRGIAPHAQKQPVQSIALRDLLVVRKKIEKRAAG